MYWVSSFFTACVAAILAFYIWQRRPSKPAIALSVYLLSAALWSTAYCCQLRATTLAQKVFWSKVGYIGPAGVSVAGLIFVLQFSGLNDWVRARWIALISLVPAVTQIMVWTNERHGLIWRHVWLDFSGHSAMLERSHGPWFWVFLAYGYILCFISIALLAREFVVRKDIYRSQAGVLLLGSLAPFVGNVMYSFGFHPVLHLDFTVPGFSITGIAMAWGVFRFRLPVIMPVARQAAFEGMSDSVITLDTRGNVVDVNPAAARALSTASPALIGLPAFQAFGDQPNLAKFCENPSGKRSELTLNISGQSRSFEATGTSLKTRRQQIIGSLIMLHDTTDRQASEAVLRQAHAALEQRILERTADLSKTIDELRLLEHQLTFSASHDSLTELPNRKFFLERVSEGLQTLSTSGATSFAILYVDLDRFKVYNDGYGHHLGDLILIEMSRRLRGCLRDFDMVARMGGDEFTILLNDVSDARHAFGLAEEYLQSLAMPASVASTEIQLTASIGIVVAADNQRGAEDLVRDADLAMYRAKRDGGNQIAFFSDAMRSSALSLAQLQDDLRLALNRNQIVVQYQPFVRLKTGQVVGFEALVRWRHPERGLLLPAEFLSLAEQTGMLIPIDEFVLREACRQNESWAALDGGAGSEKPFVTVNVSGWQFLHPQRWLQALSTLKSSTSRLRLELAESVLVTNALAATQFFELARLHNLEIYLDDFGTDHSSLDWLSHFPIHSLKIDRSFIKEIADGGRRTAVVQAIIALAHNLEMEVVAEGVESAAQSEMLQTLGCEFGQGYFFSSPVDGPATLAMLRRETKAQARAAQAS